MFSDLIAMLSQTVGGQAYSRESQMERQMTPPAMSPGMSDTTLCSPSIAGDGEHWESLQALSVVLQKGLSLHRNGPAQVRMSEQSLYNLVAAGEKDFLEIIVKNVSGPSDRKSSSSDDSVITCPERRSETPPKGIINAAPRPRLSYRSKSMNASPPIKSWMSWECFIGHDSKYTSWPRYIPWSADFAWDQQSRAFLAHRPPEWLHYEYNYIGMPDEEASLREIDPDSEFLAL
ncbi:hypothetical protein PG989_011532 [Apiospora arundinis]